MCNCKNIKIGSYDNQIMLPIPKHMKEYKNNRIEAGLTPFICIDKCLEKEIEYLWDLGIKTTGCCCGHNVHKGFIGVYNEDIENMKELGYEVQYNFSRPKDQDSFKPKSK